MLKFNTVQTTLNRQKNSNTNNAPNVPLDSDFQFGKKRVNKINFP